MFSTRNISPNYSVTIDSTPPRPRHPYGAFLCDDLHRAHYGTSSHVEGISHPATLRGQKQDVYSKTVKSSCSPATQGSTITGRCRRVEGRVRSQSLELTRGEENHPRSSYSYRTNVLLCFLCFLPIHSGLQWTYQPGSHMKKVTQDFPSTFFLRCL